MMTDLAIRVENLGKMYRIGRAQQRHDTLRDALVAGLRAPWQRLAAAIHRPPGGQGRPTTNDDTIWALRDVSFEVQRGEVVGIIGRNGAGKSTLLKILSRITEPTTGRAEIHGRVGSLLEVGTGFHPELTGRENIYLNGAILGMRRQEIEEKFDEIVAFAEIEKFLDTPVKRYSSGMYVRLAFAVAAHLEPEILLVDEVLAVGDTAFQRKCLGKMSGVARAGRTVLFVSHNMVAIQSLCQSVLLLQGGVMAAIGQPSQMIDIYLDEREQLAHAGLRERQDRSGSGAIRIKSVSVEPISEWSSTHIYPGCPVRFVLEYVARESVVRPSFHVGIYNRLGISILHFSSRMTGYVLERAEGVGRAICEVPRLPLPPGHYVLNLSVVQGDSQLDHVDAAEEFDVEHGDFFGTGHSIDYTGGMCLVDHQWKVEG